MMRLARIGLVVALVGLSPLVTWRADAPVAQAAPPVQAVPGEYIVHYAPGMRDAELDAGLSAVGGRTLDRLPQLNAALVSLPAPEDADALLAMPGVVRVEPNLLRQPSLTPNDPRRTDQWGLGAIHAYDAWDVTRGAGQVIAVLDTGVDLDHPDLAGHLLPGFDYVDDDANPQDTEGHGTHVMGIANALTDNGVGVAGVAWDAQTLPVRIIGPYGASSWDIAQGLSYAADQGAQVVNMSLGGPGWVQMERDAVNYARAREVVIVAAAGNDNSPVASYPASYDHVLSVASVTSSLSRSSFSNFGPFVDIAAPGSSIYSTYYNNTYAYLQGTSMASPHVAGAAALVWSAGGATTAAGVIEALLCSTQDLGAGGRDDYFGWGLVRADNAVSYTPGASCLPSVPHDDFDTARTIDSSLYTDVVDVNYATSWLDDPPPCAGDTFRTVWYTYVPFRDGTLALDTVTSTYDTVLGVYSGTRGDLTQLACNDDHEGGPASAVEVQVQSGQPVYVMVSSREYEGGGGTLTLHSTFQSYIEPGCYPASPGSSVIICTTR